MGAKADVKISGSSDSLRYLDSVGLEIARLPRVLQDEGWTRQKLFSFLKERLERGPVQVVSRTCALHLTGAPTLFLELSAVRARTGILPVLGRSGVRAGVRTERSSEPDRVFAVPTWQAQVIGLAAQGELQSLHDPIGAAVDAFANGGEAE